MTIETRGLIEIKDIVAIELECKKCGARLVLGIKDLENVPTACAHCGKSWFNHSSPEHGRLHHLVQKLRDFAAAASDPYILRLEVKGLADSKPISTST